MPKVARAAGDTRWFVHDRFGMFIHWGLYALPARHEWVMKIERIPPDVYEQKYFSRFDPDLYDPRLWARAAANAGMKYFVITTKHHDGFCLWDSKLTDYKAPNAPCGRDLIAPMVDAFRQEGLRVGLYHSVIDWHHPHFPIDGNHPLREHPRLRQMNRQRDIRKYADYLHGQVEELLTQYGRIDLLWCDFSYSARTQDPVWKAKGWAGKGKDDWQSEKLVKLIRRLQPQIMINDRLEVGGDFKTPEQFQPREWVRGEDGKLAVWEACQTFSGSWGYHRDESTWKSPEQLVQMLINSVACGGNLLMNVGPTGRGEFDARALAALEVYGRWLRVHGRSIYGCTASRFTPPADCRYTQNGKRLYLHVFNWPFKHLHADGLGGRVEYAQLLNDASEIAWSEPGKVGQHGADEHRRKTVTFTLPIQKPGVTVPVIEIFLR